MSGESTKPYKKKFGFRKNGKGSQKGNSNPSKKKSLSDYMYYLGSAKQASDYEVTTAYLVNHIKSKFEYGDDIGKALETLTEFNADTDKPTLTLLPGKPEDVGANNEQSKMEFKEEYAAYMRRKQMYRSNKTKAFAFLWEHCAKSMQNKILSRKDYESTVKDNPIELLKAIKQHALNYQENRYEMAIIYDALKTLLLTRQKEGENLQDYTRRFCTARDIAVSHLGGPIILTKVVPKMNDYDETDADKVTKCQEQAWNQFLGYMYLEQSDKQKYGTLTTGLATQQSLNNDQYPKSITHANNVLSNHKFDTPEKRNPRNPQKNTKGDETSEESPTLAFTQTYGLEGKCYVCGKDNHKAPQCFHKNKPKDQWAINIAKKKAEQAHNNQEIQTANQSQGSSTAGTVGQNNEDQAQTQRREVGWAATHVEYLFHSLSEMRNWILLDNQSTTNIFCNPNLVTNIRRVDIPLELHSNGGVLITHLKADVPNYGEVWFSEDAMTNIFCYSDMEDKFPITYDSREDKAFYVHVPNAQPVKFSKMGKLYIFKPKYRTNYSQVNSVEENKAMYTERQFERAKKAKELYYALGTPSTRDFKAIVRSNGIKNNPVTIADIDIAEKILDLISAV